MCVIQKHKRYTKRSYVPIICNVLIQYILTGRIVECKGGRGDEEEKGYEDIQIQNRYPYIKHIKKEKERQEIESRWWKQCTSCYINLQTS